MTTPTTRRLTAGHYETTYRGRKVELVDLRLHGARGWIAPINGSNDLGPYETKREALERAILNIDAESTR